MPNKKILVADDSDDNIILIKAYLKNLPYDLVFAHNGDEAIQLVKD